MCTGKVHSHKVSSTFLCCDYSQWNVCYCSGHLQFQTRHFLEKKHGKALGTYQIFDIFKQFYEQLEFLFLNFMLDMALKCRN